MECAHCGAKNSDGSYFCMECGSALGPEAVENVAPPDRYPVIWTATVRQPAGAPVQLIYVPQAADGPCIAALALGIISLAGFWFPFLPWITGAMAVAFGWVGMRTVRKDPVTKTGYGMGLAGFIMGITGTIIGTIFFIFMWIVMSNPYFR